MDGTAGRCDWIMVVVEGETGVRYSTQCGGLSTLEKSAEGYLVPLMGSKMDARDGWVEPKELTRISSGAIVTSGADGKHGLDRTC